MIIGTMRPSKHDEAIRISKAESLKENTLVRIRLMMMCMFLGWFYY